MLRAEIASKVAYVGDLYVAAVNQIYLLFHFLLFTIYYLPTKLQ